MLRDSGPAYYAMDSAYYRDYPNAMIWNDVPENAPSGSWRSTPSQRRDGSLPSGSSCQTCPEMQTYASEPLSSFAQMLKEEDERFYATFPDARPHASTRKWIPSMTAGEYSQTYPYSADGGASESSNTRVHGTCGIPTRYDSRISYVSVSVQNRVDAGVSGYQDVQMADACDPQLPDVNHRRHPSCDRTPSLAPLRTSQSSSASSPMIFTPHRLDPGLARDTSQSPCPDDISHTSRVRNILATANLSLELLSHNENRLVCELDDPNSDYASPAESIYTPGIPRIPSLSTTDTGLNSPSKSDDDQEGHDTCFTFKDTSMTLGLVSASGLMRTAPRCLQMTKTYQHHKSLLSESTKSLTQRLRRDNLRPLSSKLSSSRSRHCLPTNARWARSLLWPACFVAVERLHAVRLFQEAQTKLASTFLLHLSSPTLDSPNSVNVSDDL
ncbi:hypothetical protein EDD18DRAFT_330928 [Armillaria luteobubalina]|uniref:Uncharacterized protein n=1 Tax=Armillaria luteobubalina TaxID=153913 RepID=A0AA39QLQ7_9AGAR|nr:hypothetical protein EDD18DRAFT_330928 [Armillaria luteobubalina]